MGQSITWIVPHVLSQVIPSDVDFRVMLTFLEFYQVRRRAGLQEPCCHISTARCSCFIAASKGPPPPWGCLVAMQLRRG